MKWIQKPGPSYAALPSVAVASSFQIGWRYRGRTPSFFTIQTVTGRRGEDESVPFSEEALVYAKQHWGAQLIEDTWKDFLEIILEDPQTGVAKSSLYVGLNCLASELFAGTTLGVPTQRLDEAAMVVTHDAVVAAEYKGRRGSYALYACGICGGAFSNTRCRRCNARRGQVLLSPARSVELSPRLLRLVGA